MTSTLRTLSRKIPLIGLCVAIIAMTVSIQWIREPASSVTHSTGSRALPKPSSASHAAKTTATDRPTGHDGTVSGDAHPALAMLSRLLASSGDQRPGELPEMIWRALDASAPLLERVRAVRWLARSGSDEAFKVLERLLREDENPTIRQEVVAALGDCPHPDAARVLETVLEDDSLVTAAIQALAARGDMQTLQGLLSDTSRKTWIRVEAAIALGRSGGASARAILTQALSESHDEELTAGLLQSLSFHDFAEIAPVFRSLLADPDVDKSRKIDLLERLAESSAGASDLLIDVAATESDQTLREAAVESLAWTDDSPAIAATLSELVSSESSSEVRAAIYRTLGARSDDSPMPEDLDRLLPSLLSEDDPVARREAYRMTANLLRREAPAELTRAFDDSMVPWLKHDAEHGKSPYARKTSLGALALAGTRASEEALLDLADSQHGDIAEAARRALERRRRALGN